MTLALAQWQLVLGERRMTRTTETKGTEYPLCWVMRGGNLLSSVRCAVLTTFVLYRFTLVSESKNGGQGNGGEVVKLTHFHSDPSSQRYEKHCSWEITLICDLYLDNTGFFSPPLGGCGGYDTKNVRIQVLVLMLEMQTFTFYIFMVLWEWGTTQTNLSCQPDTKYIFMPVSTYLYQVTENVPCMWIKNVSD